MASHAIEITGLVKRFGRAAALDGLDMTVHAGEVHGFLGPNGSGKSTTIRVLLGLLRATSGQVRVLDGDPWRDAVELHRRLAYVPGDVSLWPNLTAGEVVDLLGGLGGRTVNRQRRDELVELFELDTTKRCRALSKGNRQKVALVSAFASDVELLILDEPTSGLDPLMEAVFQRQVNAARDAGTCVLLSSHILAEVEALCDRVSIVREGKIVEHGTLAELRHLTRTSLRLETAEPLDGIESLDGVHDPVVEGNRARLQVDSTALGAVMQFAAAREVQSLTSSPPTLEDLFLRHYGADSGAGAGLAKAEGPA